MAKKPTGRLTRGEKKKIKSKNGQKNILDVLPGMERRKIQEKMAKDPTGGWRTYQGGKETNKE